MVRTSKTTEKPATASADAEKKRVKKEKVPESAPPAAPVEEVSAPESNDSSVSQKMNEYQSKLQQLANLFNSLKSDFKTLEKCISRELKNSQKNSNKKRKVSGTRAPSGFVKPTKISEELAAFLGKEKDILMARTEVSKEINQYIREKKLQDAQNGRKIHPDGPLKKLLQIGKDDELTYFNLQRYMKHHFVKPAPPVAAPSSA